MMVEVFTPAAWCWMPLDDPRVVDPDIADDPPRYEDAPEGGWAAIGNHVCAIMEVIQNRHEDPLQAPTSLDVNLELTPEQNWIVWTWFSQSEAPRFHPNDDSWTNGRHRTWGLKSAGFSRVPVLFEPLSDAIYFWYPDPNGWPPLDEDSIVNQREELDWWLRDPAARGLREANTRYVERWAAVLSQWDARLAGVNTE